jgi:6,7-dimethyl-8-ribityllumazine synthase
MKTYQGSFDATGLRVGLVVSRFNRAITERLHAGARQALREHGVAAEAIEMVEVPGAFEIPLCAQWLAASGRLDAIVCLGAVVRGETPHFEYISAAVVDELCRLSVAHRLPIALGILTTNTVEQALARAGAAPGNKGYEAAMTAIEMATLRRTLTGGQRS